MTTGDQYPKFVSFEPTLTEIPSEWMEFVENLAQEVKGSPHAYLLDVPYDAKGVGTLLGQWGLPRDVVLAGYLWEYSEEQIRASHLKDVDLVLGHIEAANVYGGNIRDDNWSPLLTPPYKDLGGLLVA